MSEQYILEHNNRKICVNIIYSIRRSIGIEIKPDLSVNVRAPKGTPKKYISELVEDKADWIVKMYDKAETELNVAGRHTHEDLYADGAVLPYKGRESITLRIIKTGYSDRAKVDFDKKNNVIKITTLNENPEFIRNCAVEVYRSLARMELEQKTVSFSRLMGINYNKIFIKEQRTKWGSCSSKGNINYNWKLILMPEEIIDYVVVHELAHRREMNHSKNFWAEVEKVLPDYGKREKMLKMNEKYYMKY